MLMVYRADGIGTTVDGEFEIYGRYLQASNHTPPRLATVGASPFRISHVGSEGSSLRDAAAPDVATDLVHFYPFQGIIGVRDIVNSMFSGFSYEPSAIVDGIQSNVEGGRALIGSAPARAG